MTNLIWDAVHITRDENRMCLRYKERGWIEDMRYATIVRWMKCFHYTNTVRIMSLMCRSATSSESVNSKAFPTKILLTSPWSDVMRCALAARCPCVRAEEQQLSLEMWARLRFVKPGRMAVNWQLSTLSKCSNLKHIYLSLDSFLCGTVHFHLNKGLKFIFKNQTFS